MDRHTQVTMGMVDMVAGWFYLNKTTKRFQYLRVHGHGCESSVDVFVECVGRVACEQLGWVELVFAAELLRREAIMLPYFVQVRLGGNHHTWCLAVYEVLLPNTTSVQR